MVAASRHRDQAAWPAGGHARRPVRRGTEPDQRARTWLDASGAYVGLVRRTRRAARRSRSVRLVTQQLLGHRDPAAVAGRPSSASSPAHRARAKSTGRRLSGSTSEQVDELGALVRLGTPGRISWSSFVASVTCHGSRRRSRPDDALGRPGDRAVGETSPRRRPSDAAARTPRSVSVQVVCSFASRTAFSRYAVSRSSSIGQSPSTVWATRYAVVLVYAQAGALPPSGRADRVPAGRGPQPAASSRARASSLRLVSCVDRPVMPAGGGRLLSPRPFVQAGRRQDRPGSRGSPPTSLSATIRCHR